MMASSFMLCRQQEFSAGLLVSQNVPEETMLSISKAVWKQKQLATVPASAVGLTYPSMTRTATWLKQASPSLTNILLTGKSLTSS
jgi:hypothetical protein